MVKGQKRKEGGVGGGEGKKPWWSGSWSSGQAEEAVLGQGLGGQEWDCGSPERMTGGACLAGVCWVEISSYARVLRGSHQGLTKPDLGMKRR